MNKVYRNKGRSNKNTKKKPNLNSADYVTVFCDASHCHETSAAGAAVWIKYGDQGKTIEYAWSFTCEDSNAAELKALEKGVEILLHQVEINSKFVILTSDCIGALEKVDIEPLKQQGARHVKLKHVKGHTSGDDPRSKVNRWCDKIAKSKMQERRKFVRNANGQSAG